MNPTYTLNRFGQTLVVAIILLFSTTTVKAQGTSHFNIMANLSGDASLFKTSSIEDVSRALDSLAFTMQGNHAFSIAGVDLVPIAGYFQDEDANEIAYHDYLSTLRQGQGEYIAFFIDYDEEGKRIPSFEFSMPRGGSFDEIPEISRLAIENRLRNTFQFYANTQIDYAVYMTLSHCFRLFSGEEEVAFSLEELEFTKLIHVDTISLPALTKGNVLPSTNQIQVGIHDYSGLYFDGVSLGAELLNLPLFQSYSTAVYISTDYSETTVDLFDDAAGSFGNESELYSMWLFIRWISDDEYEIWAKGHTNRSEEDAFDKLVQYFDATVEPIAFAKENGEGYSKSSGTPSECVGKVNTVEELASEIGKFPSGKWSHGKDWTAYCIGAEKYNDGFSFNVFENLAQLHDGFIAGLVDGLAGTISGIYLLAKGYNAVVKHVPFTTAWFYDIIIKTIKYQDIKKAWKMNFEEGMKLYTDFLGMVKKLVGNLHCILEDIKAMLINTLNKLNPATGLYSTAYIHGLIAFEIVMEVLTGGAAMATKLGQLAGGVSRLGTKIASLGKGAATTLLDPKRWHDHIDNFAKRYEKPNDYLLTPEVVSCLSSIGKCFIGSTLVVMASGPMDAKPIEALQPMDLVVSKVEKNEFEEDVIDAWNSSPLVSAEQIYLDQFAEVEGSSWMVGTFSALGGSLSLKIVREKSWYQNLGANRPGDEALIQLPEMGVANQFVLEELTSLTNRQLADFDRNGSAQPVTAKIKRTADLVLGLCVPGDTIGVTPEHRIFSYDRQEYVEAGSLKEGEHLETLSGRTKLLGIDTLYTKEVAVYNLEVRKNHNYYVGKNEVLVHNSYGRDFLNKFREGGPRTVYKLNEANPSSPILRPDGSPEIDEFGTFVANMPEERYNKFLDELNIAKSGIIDENAILVRAWEVASEFPNLRRQIPVLERLSDKFDDVLGDIKHLNEEFLSSGTSHIDLGGFNRYPDALKITRDPQAYTPQGTLENIRNHLEGEVEDFLPRFKESSMDRFSAESFGITPEIASEMKRVIKDGGEIRIMNFSQDFIDQYIPLFGDITGSVNYGTFTDDFGIDYITATILVSK